MSNGAICCARRICCPPKKALAALSEQFTVWISPWVMPNTENIRPEGIATDIATRLLAEHDLAPVGLTEAVKDHRYHDDAILGAAVRALYQDDFKALAAHEAGKQQNAYVLLEQDIW